MVNFLHLLAIVNSKQVQHVNEQAMTAEQAIASDQPAQSASKVRHALWAVGGFLCLALGMVGVVLPILPTTPFILVAAFCFARSSMTLRAKLTILIPVTVLLAIGFALMGRVPVGRVVLAAVWIGHIIYFGFIVKTDKQA